MRALTILGPILGPFSRPAFGLTAALRLLLVLALALTSVHTAIGRAEARGATDLVICAEGGVATVSLDARGEPVVHLHGCPDCVLGGLAVSSVLAPVVAAPRRVAGRMARPKAGRAPAVRTQIAVRARGPPVTG